MLLRRSMSVMPSATRRSSSTERISEPSWSFWLRFWASSLSYPVGGAVKKVDGRPEQVFEVGFEARVAEGGDQGVENIGDGAPDVFGFRQGAMVGLVLERPVAVELEFGEQVGGGRRSVDGFKIGVVAAGRHGDAFRWTGRAHRGLRGDHSTAGGRGLHRLRP
jgi:hypothetical protein